MLNLCCKQNAACMVPPRTSFPERSIRPSSSSLASCCLVSWKAPLPKLKRAFPYFVFPFTSRVHVRRAFRQNAHCRFPSSCVILVFMEPICSDSDSVVCCWLCRCCCLHHHRRTDCTPGHSFVETTVLRGHVWPPRSLAVAGFVVLILLDRPDFAPERVLGLFRSVSTSYSFSSDNN